MAASMFLRNVGHVGGEQLGKLLIATRYTKVISCLRSPLLCHQSTVRYSNHVGPYYVLLPEIPPDTPETNPVMRVDNYPLFNDINPDNAVTGCAKLAIEFDVQLGKHSEKLKDGSKAKTFETVFDPIERLSVPLDYAWRTAKHLNYTRSSSGYREAFKRIHRQVERAKNERWINHSLYHAVQEVNSERHSLTAEQKRLVDMYLLEARLNGINLSGNDKKQFVQLFGRLAEDMNHFRNRVMLSQNLFSHMIYDVSEIAEMPKDVAREFAMDKANPDRGPWRVTLNQNLYNIFLQYCGHRPTRWNLWQAYNNRASVNQIDQNLSNHVLIESIREYRQDIAKLLGYNNFVEMSMETKMAGSIDAVVSMLAEFRSKFKDKAGAEIANLQEFARSEGFTHKLRSWDVAYWRRRQWDHLYKGKLAGVPHSFPYPTVRNFLFKFCQSLFGITITDCTGEVDVWHPSVNFYKVYNSADGTQISAFYVDPYARSSEKLLGVWMEAGRERSKLMNTLPFSYLNLNIAPPLGNEPTLMSVEQVYSLFHEFGHGLQQMLTTVPYSEISGQRNVEWDSLQTCAKLMMMFAQHPKILTTLSSASGVPLSADTVQSIVSSRQHLSAYDFMRQLYYCAFDFEIYVSTEAWQRVMARIWKQHIPIPIADEDNHPCALNPIFTDQYPAAYYSIKWSEMIAADIFGAFEEGGLDDLDALGKTVGRKFRDTYLSLGGGVSAAEVFRQFRGRDPSRNALINYMNKT